MAKKELSDYDLDNLPPQEDEIQKKLKTTANKIEHYQLVAYDPYEQMINFLYCLPSTFDQIEDSETEDRRAKNYAMFLAAIEDLQPRGFDFRTAAKQLVASGLSATAYKAEHKLRWFQTLGLIVARVQPTPTTKGVYEISEKAMAILNKHKQLESEPA